MILSESLLPVNFWHVFILLLFCNLSGSIFQHLVVHFRISHPGLPAQTHNALCLWIHRVLVSDPADLYVMPIVVVF